MEENTKQADPYIVYAILKLFLWKCLVYISPTEFCRITYMAQLTRRDFSKHGLAALASIAGNLSLSARANSPEKNPIPLILDTDIGDDIDDTWALMMLLRTKEIDTKLITTGFGNTRYRTRLLAKLLNSIGRADIPVGMGLNPTDNTGNQSEWLGNFALEKNSSLIHEDGVQAMINTIKQSPEPVTLLCIGPAMNIAEALSRDPSIAKNAHFVGMHGSIRSGYDGELQPAQEWNVKVDPTSLRKVFSAPWDCSIAPLDTCGVVQLKGKAYKEIFQSRDKWMKVLIDNYRMWLPKATWLDPKPDFELMSSTLFDTVAVHLAHSEEFLVMEDLPLTVTDEGYTVIDHKNGRTVRCATAWKNQPAFEHKLVRVLSRKVS